MPLVEQDTTVNDTTVKSEPSKAKTEKVDVSNLVAENPNTITVEWGSESGKENSFFEGPTRTVDEPAKAPGNSTSATQSSGTFSIGIKVLIAIIDFLMSTVLKIIAGDNYSGSFTADTKSKENLELALNMIMEENKIKLPTWLVVLFAFLAAYGFQIMSAIDARKNKNKNPEKTDDREALKIGPFEKDGIKYRRYANGAVHERKFKPNGDEIIIGQPSRRRVLEAA